MFCSGVKNSAVTYKLHWRWKLVSSKNTPGPLSAFNWQICLAWRWERISGSKSVQLSGLTLFEYQIWNSHLEWALAHKATCTNPLVWSSFLHQCQHEIRFLAPTHPTDWTHSLTALVSEVKGIPQWELLWCVYRALFKHLWLAYLPLTITLDTKSINFSPMSHTHCSS